MIIKGLQKTTLLDYPGHVAATIFLGGCNFRCPFCHNMNLVKTQFIASANTTGDTESVKEDQAIDIKRGDFDGKMSQEICYTEEEVLSFLKKRKGVLDGVCITGGEPTLYADLPEFIEKIKQISGKTDNDKYLVKLDTNGTNPKMLKELIEKKLIDYVAMDIKTSEERYAEVAGLYDNVQKDIIDDLVGSVKESIGIILNADIDYEFRTTIVKEYHTEKEINGIGEMIKGAKKYYLQSFTDSEYVLDHTLNSVDKETIEEFASIMREYVSTAEVRGVD